MKCRTLAAVVIATFVVTGCQIPWGFVVVNATRTVAVVKVIARGPDGRDACEEPRSVAFVSKSVLGRLFRTPKRSPADWKRMEHCEAVVELPPETAVEFEFDPVTGFSYFQNRGEFVVSIEGEAGSITMRGRQIEAIFERDFAASYPVFRYRQ